MLLNAKNRVNKFKFDLEIIPNTRWRYKMLQVKRKNKLQELL